MPDVILLQRGRSRAVVAPALGGALLSFTVGDHDVLRPGRTDCTDILAAACFPLVPFANRIAFGRIEIRNHVVTLAGHPISAPHALHGDGWRNLWDVVHTKADRLSLELRHSGGGWPWPYRAELKYRLLDDALAITLALTNLARGPMPAGLGLHPYLSRRPDAAITTGARTLLVNGSNGLPIGEQPFRSGRSRIIDLAGMDNLLLDASGKIEIVNGGVRVRMDATGIVGFHLFVPMNEDFFCVEPVSHRPNAFARPDAADLLLPRHTRRLAMRISVTSPSALPREGKRLHDG